MTRSALFIFVAAFGLLCAGCSGLSTNPSRAARTISGWIPAGTPEDNANKIMAQRGFTLDYCEVDGHGGKDYHFYHVTKFHSWLVQIHTQDGKVTVITVPRVFFDLIQFRT